LKEERPKRVGTALGSNIIEWNGSLSRSRRDPAKRPPIMVDEDHIGSLGLARNEKGHNGEGAEIVKGKGRGSEAMDTKM
jgi:hypothetical protein